MAVKDNRILINAGESDIGWFATSSETLDQDIFYQGSGSLGEQLTKTSRALMYDTGTTGHENSHFYFLVNCGVVGILLTRSQGGFTFRFSSEVDGGNADNNYFEVYAGGSDSWPLSFAGGWTVFIVDIEKAREEAVANGWTAGTVPATTAVQSIGFSGITIKATRNTDNTWIDTIYKLPYGEPGFIVEGLNGSAPYTFADILSFEESTKNAGFRSAAGGAYVSSVPIRFGNNTTSTTHSFVDNNITLLWDTQYYANSNFYTLSFENVAGSTLNVTAGEKSGTGDDASGSQGWTIQAAEFANSTTYANRWSFYANNNLANVALYGCTFSHADVITFENANLTSEIISTVFLDTTELVHSSNTQYTIDTGTPLFQRLTVVNANTVDNQAFVKTVNPTNIKFSSFQFSNGHAMEISSLTGFPASANDFTLTNVGFTGYSTANNNNDSTIFNNTGRAITLRITGGDVPTVREGTGADTEIISTVNATITNLLLGSEIRIYLIDTGDPTNDFKLIEQYGVESVGTTSVTTGLSPNKNYLLKILKKDYIMLRTTLEIATSDISYRAEQQFDRVYQAGGS